MDGGLLSRQSQIVHTVRTLHFHFILAKGAVKHDTAKTEQALDEPHTGTFSAPFATLPRLLGMRSNDR